MESTKQLTGLKKRQQIANANRMIFIWVIVASIAVSLCGVTVQFLVRQAIFNQKIISAKLDTQGTLDDNLKNIETLKIKVDELIADDNLAKVKANPTDTNLKVVLDALPTADDKSALGASMQRVVLARSQIVVSELTTISVSDAIAADPALEGTDAGASSVLASSFTFTANGDYERVKNMFTDIERTIRPINIKTLTLQGMDGAIRVTVGGEAYYYPAQSVQLGKKTINP